MFMHSIREMCAPGALVISDWSGPEEIDAEKRWLKPLLGCVVHQAMHDGMTKVRIGVDRASGEPLMKYFGPIDYDAEKRIWWDMVPAPSEWYPGMLQVCLSLAELDQCLPIKGVIPAIRQGKHLRLGLTVNTIDSFQIAWDAIHSFDRAHSKTSYPEEAQAGDRGSDGDAAQPA